MGHIAPVWAAVFVLAVLTTDGLPSRSLARADVAARPAVITVTNTNPQFTLTLPDRYLLLQSTGDAICTFGTKDKSVGALIAVYRIGHTVELGETGVSLSKLPEARRIPVKWKTFPLDVVAWHTPSKNGTTSAARWVQIPLADQAVSITLLMPVAKESLADGLMQDFLTGLDGPSNWKVVEPLTATQRGVQVALGLGLLFVLLAGPPLTQRIWYSRRVRQAKTDAATGLRLRNLAAGLAAPNFASPRYWVRVFAVVFVLIAVALGYLALVAAALSPIVNQGFGQSFKMVLLAVESICILVFLVVLWIWFSGLRHRGRVLLELGPNDLRRLNLSVGILCLAAAIVSCAAAVINRHSPQWSNVLLPPLQLGLAIQFLSRGVGRIQITDKGIWQNLTLLRWEMIGSYRWIDESTLLAVRGEGPVSIKLNVAPERKQALQDLLKQHGLVQVTM